MRGLISCSALVIAALALPATAAPGTRTCRLVVDPRGDSDQTLVQVPGQPMDPTLDILSADIASNASYLTAVLRVDDLGAGAETPTLGKRYDVWFNGGEDGFGMSALVGPHGTRYTLSHSGGSTDAGAASGGSAKVIAEIAGVVDVSRDEVRISAPLSAFAPYYPIRAGDELYDLAAGTWSGADSALVGAGAGGSVDFAYGSARSVYPVHAPSCVRVGS